MVMKINLSSYKRKHAILLCINKYEIYEIYVWCWWWRSRRWKIFEIIMIEGIMECEMDMWLSYIVEGMIWKCHKLYCCFNSSMKSKKKKAKQKRDSTRDNIIIATISFQTYNRTMIYIIFHHSCLNCISFPSLNGYYEVV